MTIRRISLTFYMGVGIDVDYSKFWEFEQAVIKEACRFAGGCTVSQESGYWVEGAESPQFRYMGEPKNEDTFKLELLIYENEEERIYEYMRSCIARQARKYKLPMKWVHVTRQLVKALHFNIDEVRP